MCVMSGSCLNQCIIGCLLVSLHADPRVNLCSVIPQKDLIWKNCEIVLGQDTDLESTHHSRLQGIVQSKASNVGVGT